MEYKNYFVLKNNFNIKDINSYLDSEKNFIKLVQQLKKDKIDFTIWRTKREKKINLEYRTKKGALVHCKWDWYYNKILHNYVSSYKHSYNINLDCYYEIRFK